MFVTYFPELVAGPIVRASVFLPQMKRSLRPSWPRAYVGLQLVALGFSKKLLIADVLAPFVDSIFAHPSLYFERHGVVSGDGLLAADLLRLFRVFRYRDRHFANHRIRPAGKFQYAVLVDFH